MPEVSPAPHLRPARREDLDAVLPWAPDAEAVRLWAGPNLGFPVHRETLWENMHRHPGGVFVLCAADGAIVGLGQVLNREEGFAHLARIIVSPAARGRGHGRLLCRELMRVAPTILPVHRCSLYVYSENGAARALYRSLGFTDTREERGFVRMEAPLA
jgi:ribosomal protein S18 acetylase RimI-like enzyme